MDSRVIKLEADVGHIQSDIAAIKVEARENRQALLGMSLDVKNEFKEVRNEFKEVRKEMKDDFRNLFGALVVVALGLATLMAKGFGWIGG
ncbi:hypothetical protein [Pseudoxanthomonas indica]|uniref:Haemolysin XhlA n=1 Tax=Pseudoxanthomonas indica TaxID=428993 RepID=A0A1T5LVU3_9GAMM|nr:hypothetical protein [Pseudoxanthomonas indica]GGD40628.1 hypothetical protein GCM10007235_10810 [Pseudoxanthomonas indica]SKC80116.1 hypothetical protein SAMN06296058_3211 [Pseudoxanthomonas indica]